MKKAIKESTPVRQGFAGQEYSVIETGGKQYVVSPDQIIRIEKLDNELKEGDKVVFDKVLLVDDGKTIKVGTPYIKGEKIEADLVQVSRDKKITVIKYRAKSNYFVKRGHRQHSMKVQIK